MSVVQLVKHCKVDESRELNRCSDTLQRYSSHRPSAYKTNHNVGFPSLYVHTDDVCDDPYGCNKLHPSVMSEGEFKRWLT